MKEVPCMECNGKGFIAKFGEYSVWSKRCPNCGGTGIVKVPMTNADRLSAMSDEEKAKELTMLFYLVSQKTNAEHYILDWLQQPAKEET